VVLADDDVAPLRFRGIGPMLWAILAMTLAIAEA
jgi:hypothetical protein